MNFWSYFSIAPPINSTPLSYNGFVQSSRMLIGKRIGVGLIYFSK